MLNLTIKKKWFDMIASGEKKEEYREMSKYWRKRLFIANFLFFEQKHYEICLRNGYRKDSPQMIIEIGNIVIGSGKTKWGAVPGKKYFCIPIRKIISKK